MSGRGAAGLPGKVPLAHSLQLKLFLPVFLGLVFLILLQARSVIRSSRDVFVHQNEDFLRASATKLVEDLAGMLASRNHDRETIAALFQEARSLGASLEGARYVLLDADGDLLADGEHLRDGSTSPGLPLLPDLLESGRTTAFSHDDPDWLSFVAPMSNRTSCRRCHQDDGDVTGWVMISSSRPEVLATERILRRVGIQAALIVSGVFGVTVWLLVAIHVRRPLAAIAGTMSEVMDGNLATRYRPESRDEIGLLGERLNEMVSRLETADRQLREANATIMERAERMVNMGEMASRLAHEIRNPLAGIESVVSVLHEDLPEDDPDRKILGEALHQIHRIDGTISDLLVFAKPHEPEFAVVSIDRIISELVPFLKQYSGATEHEIVYERGSDPGLVRVDRDQISQALLNVVLNALQIMEEPGTVSIRTGRSRKGEVEIRVRDTGEGIPEEALPHLFEAFYTTRTKGTGLGLTISLATLRRHGGNLRVSATGPEGTEFLFTLPAHEEEDLGRREPQ